MIASVALFAVVAAGLAGCAILIVAIAVAPSFARAELDVPQPAPAVTILKPLYGDEVGLFENLASVCEQDYPGEVQIVFGVASPDDPAVAVVERLRAAFPGKTIDLVVDPHTTGVNPKVSNLVNMSVRIRHGVLVIADSDIRTGSDYLTRVVAGLSRRGGAVTCPYYGISTGNLWSQLSQLTVDSHFLPGVMIGARLRLARPCLGSTIALSRASLNAIGGFEALADCLADDYELGELLAEHGEPVTVLPLVVGHVCDESSFRELWHHELRWAATIRTIDPIGYLGWVVTHSFPLALIAWCLGGGTAGDLAGFCARWPAATGLIFAIERAYGLPAHRYWLIPGRDLLSFAVYLAGFVARDVSWRGHRLRLRSKGMLISEERSPSP